MSTLYPADFCAPAIHHPPPTAKTVREVHMEALLRETLPYLQKIEYTPWTSSVLRALIADIQFVTEGKQ